VSSDIAPPIDMTRDSSDRGFRERVRALLSTELVRFGLVGVVNTAFSFTVFAGLQSTLGHVVHYLVVLVISHVIGVLEAYVLQRWLVFRVSGHWWRDLARFWSVYLVSLGVNLVLLPILVELLHVAILPAQAMVMALQAFGTYVAHKMFTFKRPAPSLDALPLRDQA
jgi:putative flippase GtrA